MPILALFLALVLLMPTPAGAAQASGSIQLLATANLTTGTPVDVQVRVINTSTEDPPGNEPLDAVYVVGGVISMTLACTDSTCVSQLPGTLVFASCPFTANASVTCAANGANGVTISVGAEIVLPYGVPTTIAVVRLTPTVPVLSPTSGQFYQRAATGANDISAESVLAPGVTVTGAAIGSRDFFYPGNCDVRVDKQISCDGGVTWVDAGLVNNNEGGTQGCQGLSYDQIRVRYQVSNVGSLDASGCVLTDSNAAFGNPADPGTIAGNSTSGYIPGAAMPVCSTGAGNEPDTATITCGACGGVSRPGDPLLTAADIATFSCLTADLRTDRAVSCVLGVPSGFNDQTLVRANDDGTNGPATVDGQICSWEYQANNPGTAPLYDCVLTDSNNLITPAPILVGDLAPGQLISDIPATNTYPCGATLEGKEVPYGQVTLACCTRNVASLVDCEEGDRVQVYDRSTVICQTPNLNVTKLCSVNPDTNLASFTVTATNTGQAALEDCVATDFLWDGGLCPASGTSAEQALNPAGPFDLAASGNLVLTGNETIATDSCNEVSVTCYVAGTGEPITREDDADCPWTPPREGCLTRTPGFWGTHPAVTSRYLNVEVCGNTINNVNYGNATSAIEAICSVGQDHKILGSQLTQLVRQCTAAALNIKASIALEGDCDTDYPGIDETFAACCGEESVCTNDVVDGYSVAACIYELDMFNNWDPDTLNFDFKTGSADPKNCQGAKNNGTVVRPQD